MELRRRRRVREISCLEGRIIRRNVTSLERETVFNISLAFG